MSCRKTTFETLIISITYEGGSTRCEFVDRFESMKLVKNRQTIGDVLKASGAPDQLTTREQAEFFVKQLEAKGHRTLLGCHGEPFDRRFLKDEELVGAANFAYQRIKRLPVLDG